MIVPVAYFVGTFPTAHLIGRFVGVDPTAQGSGNPGASNMTRVAGRWPGAVVLAGDVAKAVVPATVGLLLGGRPLGLACGAAATIGHVFPVQRRLRGGKGVATFGGTSLVAWPIIGLVALGLWGALVGATHRASVGSMIGSVSIVAGTALISRPLWETAVAAGLAVLVLGRHWSNLVRLFRRQESAI